MIILQYIKKNMPLISSLKYLNLSKLIRYIIKLTTFIRARYSDIVFIVACYKSRTIFSTEGIVALKYEMKSKQWNCISVCKERCRVNNADVHDTHTHTHTHTEMCDKSAL